MKKSLVQEGNLNALQQLYNELPHCKQTQNTEHPSSQGLKNRYTKTYSNQKSF